MDEEYQAFLRDNNVDPRELEELNPDNDELITYLKFHGHTQETAQHYVSQPALLLEVLQQYRMEWWRQNRQMVVYQTPVPLVIGGAPLRLQQRGQNSRNVSPDPHGSDEAADDQDDIAIGGDDADSEGERLKDTEDSDYVNGDDDDDDDDDEGDGSKKVPARGRVVGYIRVYGGRILQINLSGTDGRLEIVPFAGDPRDINQDDVARGFSVRIGINRYRLTTTIHGQRIVVEVSPRQNSQAYEIIHGAYSKQDDTSGEEGSPLRPPSVARMPTQRSESPDSSVERGRRRTSTPGVSHRTRSRLNSGTKTTGLDRKQRASSHRNSGTRTAGLPNSNARPSTSNNRRTGSRSTSRETRSQRQYRRIRQARDEISGDAMQLGLEFWEDYQRRYRGPFDLQHFLIDLIQRIKRSRCKNKVELLYGILYTVMLERDIIITPNDLFGLQTVLRGLVCFRGARPFSAESGWILAMKDEDENE